MAEKMQKSFRENVDPVNKRNCKKTSGIYLMEHINCSGILVECGFLSNKAEEALLMQETYRQQAAEAIVQGILDWKNLQIEKPQPLPAQDRSDEPRAE